MEYQSDKQYTITYLDKQGNEKQGKYSPDKDTNIAGMINGFKNVTEDFLKLKNIEEINPTEDNISESKSLEESKLSESSITTNLNQPVETEYTMNSNIKDWYIKEYPEDELGEGINSEITFKDIWNDIGNIEEETNIYDSIVRERIFNKLAELLNVDYDIVYNKWIDSEEDIDNFIQLGEAYLKEDENQEEVKDNIEDAIEEIENTEETKVAVESSNSTIDVLLASEQASIDTYNSFLTQSKKTLIPSLYEVLEKEIQEIINDEKEHITKLNTIKEAFHLNEENNEK